DAFSSLASVTTIGNHDSGSAAYNEHFNLPNESTKYGETNAGTDYWFVYNNTLFMDINSNDMSTAEHKVFMEEAIAANPDVTWKTVIFHHSVYSTASHTDDSDII
ncbi:phosphohydrolase, partial [Mediterraneibacter glycyrrhizinilyticus]|nr:phosphohydrolase [Mediterraneibacter glycyrrhizinilyticus]